MNRCQTWTWVPGMYYFNILKLYSALYSQSSCGHTFEIFCCFSQETDYNMTYFDNGEGYGGEDEDEDDEGVYWFNLGGSIYVGLAREFGSCQTGGAWDVRSQEFYILPILYYADVYPGSCVGFWKIILASFTLTRILRNGYLSQGVWKNSSSIKIVLKNFIVTANLWSWLVRMLASEL